MRETPFMFRPLPLFFESFEISAHIIRLSPCCVNLDSEAITKPLSALLDGLGATTRDGPAMQRPPGRRADKKGAHAE